MLRIRDAFFVPSSARVAQSHGLAAGAGRYRPLADVRYNGRPQLLLATVLNFSTKSQIAGIAQARHDVGLLVQFFIDGG